MKKCCDDIDGGIFFSLSAAETLRDSEGGRENKNIRENCYGRK